MELGRFERWMSRCTTADSRRPKCRRIHRRKEFRLGESLFVLDRNPIWMTPFLPYFHRSCFNSSSVRMNFTVPSFNKTQPPLGSWLSNVNSSGPPC